MLPVPFTSMCRGAGTMREVWTLRNERTKGTSAKCRDSRSGGREGGWGPGSSWKWRRFRCVFIPGVPLVGFRRPHGNTAPLGITALMFVVMESKWTLRGRTSTEEATQDTYVSTEHDCRSVAALSHRFIPLSRPPVVVMQWQVTSPPPPGSN